MAQISSIASTNSVYAPTEQNPRVPTQTLDQDDFLKLLVTQFTNQDPLSPLKDTEYIAQMAQFTSLEQTKSMSSEISKLRSDSQMLQANSLIGRSVQLEEGEDSMTAGVVSAVVVRAGTPQLVVNGRNYDLSAVLSIQPAQTQ